MAIISTSLLISFPRHDERKFGKETLMRSSTANSNMKIHSGNDSVIIRLNYGWYFDLRGSKSLGLVEP